MIICSSLWRTGDRQADRCFWGDCSAASAWIEHFLSLRCTLPSTEKRCLSQRRGWSCGIGLERKIWRWFKWKDIKEAENIFLYLNEIIFISKCYASIVRYCQLVYNLFLSSEFEPFVFLLTYLAALCYACLEKVHVFSCPALFWAGSCSSLQGKSVCLTGNRVMPSINHSYLNLCSAKIQFSALCRVYCWLFGFIYTPNSIHYWFVF